MYVSDTSTLTSTPVCVCMCVCVCVCLCVCVCCHSAHENASRIPIQSCIRMYVSFLHTRIRLCVSGVYTFIWMYVSHLHARIRMSVSHVYTYMWMYVSVTSRLASLPVCVWLGVCVCVCVCVCDITRCYQTRDSLPCDIALFDAYVCVTWLVELVMAHTPMSHGTRRNESWHTCDCVMAHISMCVCVCDRTRCDDVWMGHGIYIAINLGAHRNESWDTCDWVMAHISMSHDTRINESWYTYQWVTAHISMSHGTHINESRHTYQRAMRDSQIVYRGKHSQKPVRYSNILCKTTKDPTFQKFYPVETWAQVDIVK